MSSNIPIIFKWYLNRQGIQGQQGVRGEDGFSPSIAVNEDTLTSYTLRVQNKNGSFITPNLRQTVQDNGGTYVRYDRSTGKMFAGFADGATDSQVGVVRLATPQDVIDGADTAVITPADLVDYLTNNYQLPIATTAKVGAVKPDGTTITIDPDGTIKGASTYVLPKASTTTLGGVKVDGTTITIDENGVIKSAGGVLPDNVLTKDGVAQVVTGSIVLNYENFQGRFTAVNSMTGASTGAEFNPSGFNLVTVNNGITEGVTGFGVTTANLVAGTNITIDKNLETNTVTINATGGGTPTVIDGGNAYSDTVNPFFNYVNDYSDSRQTNLGGSSLVEIKDMEV